MGATRDYAPPSIASGVLKILDLGLARFLQDHVGDGQLTQEGMGVGTPDYMAPEQFRDALHADVRTDIYGLGCTLYQLIAGTVPFPGSSFSEKAQAHAKKEPIPLEELPRRALRIGVCRLQDDGQTPVRPISDGGGSSGGVGPIRRRRVAFRADVAANDALPRRPADDESAGETAVG